MAVIASIFFGFVPMFLFAGFVYWLDRYEKEPKFLLGFVFIWGAVIAAGVAFILNTVFGTSVFYITNSDFAADFSTGVLSAPVIEESMKGLAVLLVFFLAYNEFDSILDGIVYAAMAALGFAATENAYYIYNYGYLSNGWSGIFELVFIRVIIVGWQHPFYTAFIGIGLAIARTHKSWVIKIIAPTLGWIIGVTIHSIHNMIATLSQGPFGLILGTTFDWLGWSLMFVFILVVILRERKLIQDIMLKETDLFTTYQPWFESVTQFGKRLNYRIKFLGTKKFRTYNKFLQLTAEMAHKLHQEKTIERKSRYKKNILDLRSELVTTLEILQN